MRIKLLSKLLIVLLLCCSISCTNKTGVGSASSKDSSKVEAIKPPSVTTVKKYDIKSGIVTYVSETMGIKGSQKLYFDDFGATELHETITELDMLGTKSRKVTCTLSKDGYRYEFETENVSNNINKLKKEVRKRKVLSMGLSDMNGMPAEMSAEMKKQYEYKDEGNETVAGVVGSKYSMKMGKTIFTGVIYKRVMLKTVMDMITITAEKFEENASIPADKFEIPKDYTVTEVQ
jgi:hypothetical protein